MRIWSISIIKSDLNWCIRLNRSLFFNLKDTEQLSCNKKCPCTQKLIFMLWASGTSVLHFQCLVEILVRSNFVKSRLIIDQNVILCEITSVYSYFALDNVQSQPCGKSAARFIRFQDVHFARIRGDVSFI